MRHAFAGLIVCWLAVCQPQADAQFLPFGNQGYGAQPGFVGAGGRGRQGSVSRANTNAYERQVDFGNNVEYTQGLSNSRAVTRQNGQRIVSDSEARTRDVDLGGLQIGNTLTRTRTNANGAVSGGIANQFRVGNVGLGASLSPDNLRQGFGLQRGADGNARLGLGLLSLDLANNVQRSNTLGQAEVNAQGRGARVGSNSNSNTNTQQYGGVNVRETVSNSNAYGRTRNGQTSANAGGFGGNAVTQGATYGGFPRQRRAPQQVYRQQPIATGNRRLVRPKRRAQFVPFGYPQQSYNNYGGGFGGFGGGFNGFNGFGNFQNTERPRRQGRPNRRGQVQSFGNGAAQGGPGFNQQAGSNNFANQNADGSQSGGSSSIGSNLAQDGSSGQVSSANTNQQNGPGSQINGAQSQALNFDGAGQQASSSNANTQNIFDGNRQTIGSNSGSTATNNDAGGSSTNIANTNTQVIRDGNQQSVTSDANSQSIFQGNGGQGNAAANTAANISSQRGPNGSVTNSATSSATATATNGQSANANANANAGGNGNGAGANAGANSFNNRNRGGANSNANVFGGFGGFGFGR